jgi:hypothetical protein
MTISCSIAQDVARQTALAFHPDSHGIIRLFENHHTEISLGCHSLVPAPIIQPQTRASHPH